MHTHHSTDAAEARSAAESFLLSEPARHNIVLTLLEERIESGEPGRYWWATSDGEVAGFAMQSPLHFQAALLPADSAVVDVLADAIHQTAPSLPGVAGEAAPAARMAGRWTELSGVGARATEAQRLYALRRLDGEWPPVDMRVATPDDLELVVEWGEGFTTDTGLVSPTDTLATATALVASNRLFLLESDGGPVSMARASAAIARVGRIGWVYTPPRRRGRGHATALVAALSARLLEREAECCVLYTQLANPTSNAIYRAIGYRVVAETMSYAFGGSDGPG